MSRAIVYLLVFLIPVVSFGQKDDLYYFSGRDTTLFGVRSVSGRVIIPPVYKSYLANNVEKVTTHQILLIDTSSAIDAMGYDYRYKIFDRQGRCLYSPYWYDNGPDYYVEGLRRFVENGKMGFCDRNGQKVIVAKYDHAEPFYRGYAIACLDCRYTRIDEDDEHCCIYSGSKYVIIDRNGNIAGTPIGKLPYGLNDSVLDVMDLKQAVTQQEDKLVKTLAGLIEVKHLYKENDDNICAVVAERPTDKNGYYLIVFRIRDSYSYGDLSFLIKPDSKTILHLDNYGNMETLSEWRKNQ